MTTCVISPNVSRESARNLAELLGANYHAAEHNDLRMYDNVINYGSSHDFLFKKVINHPAAVKICVNKLSTFKRIEKDCDVIPWTKDKAIARQWLDTDGCVVARANETGSQNSGLTFCENLSTFNAAPAKFYTRMFWHTNELRLNVYKGKLLTVYDKIRQKDGTWKFHHVEVKDYPKAIADMITAIQKHIGIDLYGMDVLVNKKGQYRLLEVNTGAILHEETQIALVPILKKEL